MEKNYSEYIGIPHDKKDLDNWELDNETYAETMKLVDKQLLVIKDALKNFVADIIEEQPDVIAFLDKGARIFGTPMKKYLEELKLPKMPEIVFFNDDYLKHCYLHKTLLDGTIIEDNMGHLADKKVFFLDETMTQGRGAATLKMIKDGRVGFQDIRYYALTYWRQARDDRRSDEHHERILEDIRGDKNFKIHYENYLRTLFSNEMSDLYVRDAFDIDEEKTRTRHVSRRKEKHGARGDLNKSRHRLNFKTIADIKKKILEMLRSLDISEKK